MRSTEAAKPQGKGEGNVVYVDNRAGSKDYYPLLKMAGLPVALTTLAFGDVCFIGNGPNAEPVSVGIEIKQISDLLSCITNGRFAGHQLPGLINTYDHNSLLVVGSIRSSPQGLLETWRHHKWKTVTVGSRRFMYRDLWTWLFTLKIKAGVNIAFVSSSLQATLWLSTLYRWWEKGWDNHKSHLAVSTVEEDRHKMRDRALLLRPTLVQKLAAQLSSIGYERSKLVAARFQSVPQMMAASEEDWRQVKGIGKGIAEKVMRELHG